MFGLKKWKGTLSRRPVTTPRNLTHFVHIFSGGKLENADGVALRPSCNYES